MQTDTLTQEQFLEAIWLLAQPTWADLAGVVVGFLQVGLIGWGLWQMSQSGKRRDRALDQQAETLGKIGQALDRQGSLSRVVTPPRLATRPKLNAREGCKIDPHLTLHCHSYSCPTLIPPPTGRYR